MPALFEHVLVPLDFTRKSSVAIEYALDLARQNNSRVTLMHVIETIEYAEDRELAEFYEMLRKHAEAKLAACAERFQKASVPVSQEIVMGKTVGGIVGFAMQQDVDLVVLSSHKITPDDTSKGWATLSYQVSILCQCPVMLVK